MAIHDPTPVRHIILSVLVENRSGVLSKVVGLFSARGFNIDSLAVGETEDASVSRITLVVGGDERTLEQIKKQLNKLIDVIKIQDLTDQDFVERGLMIVKVKTTEKLKQALENLKKNYRMSIIEENDTVTVVECAETTANTKKLFDAFNEIGIVEMAQTGTVALSKKAPKE